MPASIPVGGMPTFTVLTPHYSEKISIGLVFSGHGCLLMFWKILLSLREIIHEDINTSVTLLEYPKQLHSVEWDNFVKDTKIQSRRGIGNVQWTHSIWRRKGFQGGRSSLLLYRFQELFPRIHASYQDLVLASRPDSLPNCFQYDELREGHQTSIPR